MTHDIIVGGMKLLWGPPPPPQPMSVKQPHRSKNQKARVINLEFGNKLQENIKPK